MSSDASTVDSLRPTSKGVSLVVKVIDAKTVVDRPKGPKGGGSKIAECIVGDQTASILFQARDDQVELAQPGAYLSLQNANVEVHRGSMRLALDKTSGKIEAAEGQSFKPAVGNNLSLIEFEVVTINQS